MMRVIFDWVVPIAVWAIGVGIVLGSIPAIGTEQPPPEQESASHRGTGR